MPLFNQLYLEDQLDPPGSKIDGREPSLLLAALEQKELSLPLQVRHSSLLQKFNESVGI
jgi:hypothetical protein